MICDLAPLAQIDLSGLFQLVHGKQESDFRFRLKPLRNFFPHRCPWEAADVADDRPERCPFARSCPSRLACQNRRGREK